MMWVRDDWFFIWNTHSFNIFLKYSIILVLDYIIDYSVILYLIINYYDDILLLKSGFNISINNSLINSFSILSFIIYSNLLLSL